MLKSHIKEVRRIIDNIKKEKFLSMSNILVMIVTFLVLGFLVIIISLTQTAIRNLESQAQITIFFKDDFSPENIISLRNTYASDARIDSVTYVSKEDAFKIFSEINKDEPVLLESISANILPASLEIKTKNIKNLSVIADEFSSIDGVEDIRFFKDVIEKFKFWSHVFYIGGFSLLAIFMFISYSVIMYTLKATINSKGIELSILKLVGASDTYVKNPFVYQGMVFGLLSSFIAGLIILIIAIVVSLFGIFQGGFLLGFVYGVSIHPILFSLVLMLLLMAFGGYLGYLGSSIAVKKYLKY